MTRTAGLEISPNQIHTPSLRKVLREVDAKDPRGDIEITLRQNLMTTIGAHGLTREIQLMAAQLKVDCQITSGSGWFQRQHLVVLTGPARKCLAIAIDLERSLG